MLLFSCAYVLLDRERMIILLFSKKREILRRNAISGRGGNLFGAKLVKDATMFVWTQDLCGWRGGGFGGWASFICIENLEMDRTDLGLRLGLGLIPGVS